MFSSAADDFPGTDNYFLFDWRSLVDWTKVQLNARASLSLFSNFRKGQLDYTMSEYNWKLLINLASLLCGAFSSVCQLKVSKLLINNNTFNLFRQGLLLHFPST